MTRFGHPPPPGLRLPFGHHRSVGLGLLSSGVVCPCHVLVGLASLLSGGTLLTPAAQDGLHAVYVPIAVLGGALLLRTPRSVGPSRRQDELQE
jgi:hypothetical protein